ncbi:MAG: hypothetical protein JW914_10095 [Syntrophaceae bacterium]|nr:hypothetical protein [Syntrophaceae bacterium]
MGNNIETQIAKLSNDNRFAIPSKDGIQKKQDWIYPKGYFAGLRQRDTIIGAISWLINPKK